MIYLPPCTAVHGICIHNLPNSQVCTQCTHISLQKVPCFTMFCYKAQSLVYKKFTYCVFYPRQNSSFQTAFRRPSLPTMNAIIITVFIQLCKRLITYAHNYSMIIPELEQPCFQAHSQLAWASAVWTLACCDVACI